MSAKTAKTLAALKFLGGAKSDEGSGTELPLSSILPSKTNRVIDTSGEDWQDFVRSIEKWGVVQPITVRRAIREDDDATFYEIIAGERRYLASKQAGKKTIPAIVRPDVADDDALAMQISENIQRENYNPLVLAEKIQLLRDMGKSTSELAALVGKSEKRISDILCQLNLIEPLREVYAAGHISYGHVMWIARLAPALQERALRALYRIPDYEKVSTSELVKRIEQNDMRAISEKELRVWVQDNVNLKMGNAAWKLDDPELYPEVGPCTTCRRRSKNNPELYAEIAGNKDLCMDAACYKEKAQRFVKIQKIKAKEDEVQYLKLSEKTSHSPCTDLSATIKKNQWEPAKQGTCKDVAQGILIDGPSAGKRLWVCTNAKCKTHPHNLLWNDISPRESTEEREARQKREEQAIEKENSFRQEAVQTVLTSAIEPERALRAVLHQKLGEANWQKVAEWRQWSAFPTSGAKQIEYITDQLAAMNVAELVKTLLMLELAEMTEFRHYYNLREQHQEFVSFLKLVGVEKAAATASTTMRKDA